MSISPVYGQFGPIVQTSHHQHNPPKTTAAQLTSRPSPTYPTRHMREISKEQTMRIRLHGRYPHTGSTRTTSCICIGMVHADIGRAIDIEANQSSLVCCRSIDVSGGGQWGDCRGDIGNFTLQILGSDPLPRVRQNFCCLYEKGSRLTVKKSQSSKKVGPAY